MHLSSKAVKHSKEETDLVEVDNDLEYVAGGEDDDNEDEDHGDALVPLLSCRRLASQPTRPV